jgi:hypothetical protein
MYAQFTNSAEATISGIFFAKPDAATAPYQAEITESDSRYKAYYESLPDNMKPFMPTPTATS